MSNCYQKICKKWANSTKKGHFKTIGDKKVNRTDPSWNLKILGATVTKNFEILEISGSKAEFLDFDFEI